MSHRIDPVVLMPDGLFPLFDEREIGHVAELLFIYTDEKEWSKARDLFVDGEIDVDMSSLAGGGPVRMTADALLAGFAAGLHSGKASHHMTTNHIISIEDDHAELWAQGYAWNRLADAPPGTDFWETWGRYRLTFLLTPAGWKLDGLRYYAKFSRGPDSVRTHTQQP